MKEMAGEMRAEIGEVPPAMGRSMRMRMIVPYWRMMLEYS